MLRWRYRAQLLHQPHHVELSPEFDDLPVDDPVEDTARRLDTLAGGRDALQLALVRAPTGPPLGHPVPFSDQLLEGGMGLSTAEVSEELHITPNTVRDHFKAIFDKVGVRSRRELVGQVFAQHYQPRMATGQEPNIDGWFT